MPFTRRLTCLLAGLLLAVPATRPSCAQNLKAELQAPLAARLSASDEESRLDAATNLGALLSAAPGSATEPTIAALSRALETDASPVVRALVARALGLTGDARALPALLAALGRERELATRKAIIYALARYPTPQTAAALLPLLRDKKAEIRATAAYALADIADPASAQALIDVLRTRRKDEDAFLRSEAARGLGRSGAAAAAAPLVAALTRDPSPEVRREAARALGRLGSKQDSSVIEALRAATLAADPYLSREAMAALAQINARQ